MPHSNFKEKSRRPGVEKCPCGQTFNFASERDLEKKLRIHRKLCSNIVSSMQMRTPNKAMTLREQQQYKSESVRFLHENHYVSMSI